MEREFVPVSVGVMMVSDAPSTLDEATAKLIVDRLVEVGHQVTPIEVAGDKAELVTARLQKWIRDTEIDVVIALAGMETDAARVALHLLVTRPLTGFADLFRMLTYNEIGSGAMLTDVIAAQCDTTFVFVLPASRGAVSTALDKILLPQLDLRTRPRNLVMRMPRHRSRLGTDYLESSGPKAFPREDTPFGVPPPPRTITGRPATVPPPVPAKRNTLTPPLPVAIIPPLEIAEAEIAELDPSAVVEVTSSPGVNINALEAAIERSIERSIEKSIETTGTPIEAAPIAPPKPLDDNDPAVRAAKEHAQKSPADQAAAWAAAVEEAASKVKQRATAEREAREAKKEATPETTKPEATETKPEATDDASKASKASASKDDEPAAAARDVLEESLPRAVTLEQLTDQEPRGKIEKATAGKPGPRPDHAIATIAPVIVDDPELVERQSRSKTPSVAPADLPKPRPVEPDLPVFPRRATSNELVAKPVPRKKQRGLPWMWLGACLALVAAVVLVIVIGNRSKSDAANDLAPAPAPDPIALVPNPAPPPPPPVDPIAADIEMDPDHRVAETPPPPRPTDPKPPATPRVEAPPSGPAEVPDLAKAPTNPTTTGDGCDEVSCILDKFARPCCERYKPAETGSAAPGSGSGSGSGSPANDVPVELDKTLIRIGVERFRPQIIACGEQAAGVKGTVKLSVVVTPAGVVENVTVLATPDAALGTCAAGVMRKVTFAKTQGGGSFTYPFEY